MITDKKWLSFVIEQVISNAVKYTKTGGIKIYLEDGDGTMSVPVQKASHRKEDDGENSGMKSVRLVIEDTGIGIRAEDLRVSVRWDIPAVTDMRDSIRVESVCICAAVF